MTAQPKLVQSSNVEIIKISSPDGQHNVGIAPAIGGSIAHYTFEDKQGQVDVMRAYDPNGTGPDVLRMASFPMTPFCNRIGYGKLHFDGQVFDVKTEFTSTSTGDGGSHTHPNHGDGLTSAWNVIEDTPNKVVIALTSKGEPYKYSSVIEYELTNDGLLAPIQLLNMSGRAMPFGTGHHAYFNLTDTTQLQFNAPKVWNSKHMLPVPVQGKYDFRQFKTMNDENLAPTGHGDDGSAYLDGCWAEWDGVAQVRYPDTGLQVKITGDKNCGHFVVYTPKGGSFFCAEPVTNATDAFNLTVRDKVLGTGMFILNHGESKTVDMAFKPSRFAF